MNSYQQLWWEQAKSDHAIFSLLRGSGVAECHILHYLQMCTEKLAKAYFWREEKPPARTHVGFVQFMRFLGAVQKPDRERVADLFSFTRFDDFQTRIKSVLELAYDLERITPDLANDGPNPEYPWPHDLPKLAPVNYTFPVWKELSSGRGRELMRLIQTAVVRFPEYADT